LVEAFASSTIVLNQAEYQDVDGEEIDVTVRVAARLGVRRRARSGHAMERHCWTGSRQKLVSYGYKFYGGA
jgi:hypothetical protein